MLTKIKWLRWNERYTDVCGTSCSGWEWYISTVVKLGVLIAVITTVIYSAFACGVERWDVKTLADNGSASIDFTPLASSVERLSMYPAPKNLRTLTHRVRPTETHVWEVMVLILGYKLESDGDYHIVVASPANPKLTMIAEVPDPQCMPEAYRPRITTARQWVDSTLGKPGGYRILSTPMLVIMTGVGFFDFLHHQTGVAHNGVELHPILSIEKQGTTSFTNEDEPPYGQ